MVHKVNFFFCWESKGKKPQTHMGRTMGCSHLPCGRFLSVRPYVQVYLPHLVVEMGTQFYYSHETVFSAAINTQL